MPIYEFECRKCGARFEELLGMTQDTSEIRCPKCNASDPKRLMSMFGSRANSASGASCGPGAFT